MPTAKPGAVSKRLSQRVNMELNRSHQEVEAVANHLFSIVSAER
jgi:hypothetical protein